MNEEKIISKASWFEGRQKVSILWLPGNVNYWQLKAGHLLQLHLLHNEAFFIDNRCKMRVLDSFGTDAEFNYKHYKGKIPGGRSPWGDIDLQLPQFMTMYRKYLKKNLKVLKVQKVLTTTVYWKGLAGVPALGTSAPTLSNVVCYCEIRIRNNW